MDRDEWLKFGRDMGWVGPVVCYVHDAPELTDEEQEIVDGEDGDMDAICVFIMRLMP
jgi:hypothetical protein